MYSFVVNKNAVARFCVTFQLVKYYKAAVHKEEDLFKMSCIIVCKMCQTEVKEQSKSQIKQTIKIKSVSPHR